MKLKKRIKRFIPSAHKIRQNRVLKHFGRALQAPYLWQLNKNSFALAVAIGVFIAFIPLPGHMLMAAILAMLLRANITVAIASVWISNPVTMLPMYGFGYLFGAKLLGFSIESIQFNSWKVIAAFWQPLFLGCTLVGLICAFVAQVGCHFMWRYSVFKAWQKRQLAREQTPTEAI